MIKKRLESANETCEITLAEKSVTMVVTARDEPPITTEETFETVEQAQFHMADRARERTSAGARETRYEESYDGGLREPALEAAIEQAPEHPGGYLVYADWLQQRGEPRGELIVVQHALAGKPRDATLRAREAALFADHSDRLLGPLAIGHAKVDWHCGFVRGLELGIWLSAMGQTLLEPLFAHPSIRFLHRFSGSVGNDTKLAALADRAPPTLRWLELEGDREQLADLRLRLHRLPPRLMSIEHLQVNGRTFGSVGEWLAAT